MYTGFMMSTVHKFSYKLIFLSDVSSNSVVCIVSGVSTSRSTLRCLSLLTTVMSVYLMVKLGVQG